VRLDACTLRLGTALKTYRETQLNRVTRARDRVTALADRSKRAMLALIATREARLDRSYQLLRAFSYQSVLERGFALVRDGAGHPLRSAAAVQPGMPLDIEFADGCVGATAQSVRSAGETAPVTPSIPASWKPRKPKTSSGGGSGQGSLFG
jgi:exodeoxyribonuclease VII large subunit